MRNCVASKSMNEWAENRDGLLKEKMGVKNNLAEEAEKEGGEKENECRR